jgi:hypothetical protein
MPSNRADSVDSASTRPPARLTSTMPREPSLPEPDSTTAIARSRASWASERKNVSIGSVKPWPRSVSTSWPVRTIISFAGGITYTRSPSSSVPSKPIELSQLLREIASVKQR